MVFPEGRACSKLINAALSMACNLKISTYPQHSHLISILGLICYLQIYPQEVKLPAFAAIQYRNASYDLGLQLQQVPSISLVPSDSLKLNCTGSVSFDSVFSKYHNLFRSSVYFNINFSSIAASRILCSIIRLLRTIQHSPIWHSTSPLCLQLVGLSQFLHFTCKFSLF